MVRLLVSGYSRAKVARILGISVKTVDNHRYHVARRLGLRGTTGLVWYAVRIGLVKEGE